MHIPSQQQPATTTVLAQDSYPDPKSELAGFILCKNCEQCVVRQILLDVESVPEEVCEHCINTVCTLAESSTSHTLADIARIFNLSRERIRQIEAKAIRRLRYHKRRKKLLPLYKFFKGINNDSRLKH